MKAPAQPWRPAAELPARLRAAGALGRSRAAGRWLLARMDRAASLALAPRTGIGRYALAVGAPIVTVLLMLALRPQLHSVPSPPFLGTILLVAWVAGFRAAILATVLSVFAIDYLSLAPFYSFDLRTKDVPWLLQFTAVALSLSGLATSRQRVEQERAELLVREKLARQQADRACADAEAANRAKDEFLAILSHELRTPLQSMLGWIRLLENGRLDARAAAKALETIERNTKAQIRLIEDLLDVSRIITGKLHLELRPVDLVPVVENAVDGVRSAAEARGLRLRVSLGRAASDVECDPIRLQQVLWNLLSNAVKFTPSGGAVHVRLERAGREAVITVRDTGKGISPAVLPYVFEPFRQADSSTTRKHGGLGLGLAVARHVVEIHGGTIEAASAGEGLGSTFTVRLPLGRRPSAGRRDNGAAGREDARSPEGHELEGLRVLVVDDDPDTLGVMALALRQRGADVSTADSATAALATLESSSPDLILSDLSMPGEDGYWLIRKIRALEEAGRKRIPAVALTAHARSEDKEQALLAGFESYIAKPVELTELTRVLARTARSAPRA